LAQLAGRAVELEGTKAEERQARVAVGLVHLSSITPWSFSMASDFVSQIVTQIVERERLAWSQPSIVLERHVNFRSHVQDRERQEPSQSVKPEPELATPQRISALIPNSPPIHRRSMA